MRRASHGALRRVLSHAGVALLLAAIATPLLDGTPATAQQPAPAGGQASPQRIVAVVNDELISAYDVQQRVRLIIASSNQPASQEQARRLSTQVLRSMIDERLQMQEAKRLGITAQPDEIAAAVGRIEQQNNIPAGKLAETFKAEGLSYTSFIDQAKVAISWPKVVRRRAARLVTVGDDEVDDALARIKENADKPSHLVSQIFLPVESPQDETEVHANIDRLYDQLSNGASFPTLAQQFSQDSTAGSGGDLGWVQTGQMPQELDDVLSKMPVGSISQPIRTAEGYYIVALRDRRAPLASSPDDVKVELNQIFLPIAAGAGAAETDSQKQLAQTISETVNGCADMDKLAKEVASPESGSMGTLRVGDLAQDMRKVVSGLTVGKPSAPFPVDGGLRVLMVCSRDEPTANLPSRQELQRLIGDQKMELQSRRFLRDLRQSAFIDIRA
ncbi:MAG TPA: peptidylprolyl isomerase [Alphaproteobacteria bacterium]